MKKAIVFVLVVIIGLSAIVTTPNKSSADTAYVQEVWDIICSDSFSGHDIATDSDGSIFAAGSGYDDYETIKMDTNGNVVWDEVYGTDRSDSGQGIAIDDTGDVYVTGFSYGGIMLIKYSAN